MIYPILFALAAVSGVVQAVTGFGSAILLMMLLPHFFDMLQAPALTSSITIGITAALAWRFRSRLQWKLVLLPTLLYEVGSLIVLSIADNLDMNLLGLSFGIFLIVLALYFLLFSSTFSVQATPLSACICAFISGVCSGLFGIGGPLLALYFLAATREKEDYVGNLQFVFAITTSINLVIRLYKGFYLLSFLPLTIVGILGITVGKVVGLNILRRINVDLMRKLIYGLVGISGILTVLEHI